MNSSKPRPRRCDVCGVSEKERPLYHFYVETMTCKECTPTPKEAPPIFRKCVPGGLKHKTDDQLRQFAQEWWDTFVKD